MGWADLRRSPIAVDRNQARPVVAEPVVDDRLADHVRALHTDAILIRGVEQRLLSLFAEGKLLR